METFKLSIDREREHALPDGTRITVEAIDQLEFQNIADEENRAAENETAMHEAEHAVVAIVHGVPVIHATIVPEHLNGDSTGGHVQTDAHEKGPDVHAIISASSHGRPGDSLDRRDVEAVHGKGSFEKYGEIARRIVSKNKDKIRRVALALLKEKKLTGSRIQTIMNQADKRDVENVRIRIIRPDGKEEVIMKKAKKGDSMQVPFLLPVDLPRAA